MEDGEDEDNSTEDSLEQLSEIEARLYSIVHYNDLSKPLDESITSQYDIEVTSDQQIIVALKAQPEEAEIIEDNNTLVIDSGDESGVSEAKIQKLSEKSGGECVGGNENYATTISNLETNQSFVRPTGLQTTDNSGEINKEGDGVVIVTIENSEGDYKGGSDNNNQSKPDETNNDQRFVTDAIANNSTVNTSKADSLCFNGGITPAKKKKKKKKSKKRKGAGGLEPDEKEYVVDLTSDNEDSDCQVISDLEKSGVGIGEDDSLVLNVVDDDDKPASTVEVKSGEKVVDGVTSVEKVGEAVGSRKNANESAKKVQLSRKQREAKIRIKRKSFHCPKKWTASMVKYYCKTSKRLANFDHVPLIREMKASNIPRDKWAVSKLDKKPPNNRLSNTRCDRCRQFGHVARFCIEPVKPDLCHMCGVEGHRETRCPERKCLNCGRAKEIYIEVCGDCHLSISNGSFYCEICDSRLHRKEFCPNVWRAFHMTTKDGPLIVPHSDASRRKHCSNCAGEGHLFHECRETYHSTPYSFCAESHTVPDYSRVAAHYARLKGEVCLSIALQLKPAQYAALASGAGCYFLQSLSDKENVTLRMEENILTIEGKQQSYHSVCCAVTQFLGQAGSGV